MTGFVYFIQAGDNGPVKVGWARDVSHRLRDHQIGNPYDLSVIATVMASRRALEGEFHRALRGYHMRGEWFRWAHPFSAMVKKIAAGELDETNAVAWLEKATADMEMDRARVERGLTIFAYNRMIPAPDTPSHMACHFIQDLHDWGFSEAAERLWLQRIEKVGPLVTALSAITQEADEIKLKGHSSAGRGA